MRKRHLPHWSRERMHCTEDNKQFQRPLPLLHLLLPSPVQVCHCQALPHLPLLLPELPHLPPRWPWWSTLTGNLTQFSATLLLDSQIKTTSNWLRWWKWKWSENIIRNLFYFTIYLNIENYFGNIQIRHNKATHRIIHWTFFFLCVYGGGGGDYLKLPNSSRKAKKNFYPLLSLSF